MNLNNKKIEEYLTNTLSERERLDFEQQMLNNPDLRMEFDFQRDIVEGLKDYRRTELKSRLDKVPVGSSVLYYLPKTLLVTTIVVALVVTSVLILFDSIKVPLSEVRTSTKKAIQKSQASSEQITAKTLQPYSYDREGETGLKVPNIIQKQSILEDLRQIKSIDNAASLSKDMKDPTQNTSSSHYENQQYQLSSFKVSFDKKASKVDKGKSILSIAKSEDYFEKRGKKTKIHDSDNQKSDNGIYDGSGEVTLESIAANNKLEYQHYNNMLFLYNNISRGQKVSIEDNGIMRHFIYYENEFYEIDAYQVNTEEPKVVKNPKLISLLKQKID